MEILTNIGLYHYLFLALILICICLWGIFNTENKIKKILCFNVILSTIGINFISFANYVDANYLVGFIFQLFILIFTVIQTILIVVLRIVEDK